MSILNDIYKYKLEFVEKQKQLISQNEIEKKIKIDGTKYDFYEKLKHQHNHISIIGELKKASPSLGKFVNDDVDLVKIAKTYEKNNISCLSVLTDEKYFKGSLEDLEEIKKNTTIPILRKYCIVDEYQIY